MTTEQIKAMQNRLDVKPDGAWGPKSIAASHRYLRFLTSIEGFNIPRDDDATLIKRFGTPEEAGRRLKRIKVPFDIWLYGLNGDLIREISVHEIIADAVLYALDNVLKAFPTPEARRKVGADSYYGCYSNRTMRGSTRISRHAFGIALDWDASRNGLYDKWPEKAAMPLELMECWARAGFMCAGAFWLRDAMHFQWTK